MISNVGNFPSFVERSNSHGSSHKLKLHEFQLDFINNRLLKNNNLIIRSGRQMGLTTIYTAYIAWCMMLNRNLNVAYVSTSYYTTNLVRDRVVNLLTEFGFVPTMNNDSGVTLSNGSRLFPISSAEQLRGRYFELMIVDNAAFVGEEILKLACRSSLSHGKQIVSSCGNNSASGRYFNEMFSGALHGGSNSIPVYLPWYLVPTHDEAWKQETIRYMGHDAFLSENA